MVEGITIISFMIGAAIFGVTTFFATKKNYNDEHEKIKALINNTVQHDKINLTDPEIKGRIMS